MARPVHRRIRLKGTLVTQGPLHVGARDGGIEADLLLARDGQGRVYVPGTGLAGALREWMEERYVAETVQHDANGKADHLWGFQVQERGHASWVRVADAVIENPPLEIRQGVGIDRYSGTAAETIKYDRQVLPAGVTIPLHVEVDAETCERAETIRALLRELSKALAKGEIRLGAARTRGLGLVKLEGGESEELLLDTRDGILGALAGSWAKSPQPTTDLKPKLGARLAIVIRWTPKAPVFSKAELEGIAVDTLPLTTRTVDGRVALVLGGSGIKGALRTHGERVVRTVCNTPTLTEADPRKRFLQALRVPLVEDLFGSVDSQGLLTAEDCLAETAVENAKWETVTKAQSENGLRQALNEAGLPAFEHAFHVAIDRWTGGAADNLLFTVLEPWSLTWSPICLSIDIARIPVERQAATLALLTLVLADLEQGLIPLGFGSRRGCGAFKVDTININGSGTVGTQPLENLKTLDDLFRSVALKEGWTAWLKSNS